MTQRAPSPILFPNTFRDSNDIPTTRDYASSSTSSYGPMDFNTDTRHSIIRSVESDPLPSQHHANNKPYVKSIVRANNSDDDEPPQEKHEQLYTRSLINNNNNNSSILEASGYDPTQSGDNDIDAAFALQLQEEEYARESIRPYPHPSRVAEVELDDEPSAASAPPPPFGAGNQQYMTDRQLAAQLQEQENHTRHQYRQRPVIRFPIRQQSDPSGTQVTETDEIESERAAAIPRFFQRPHPTNEDDSDEDNSYANLPHQFFPFFGNQGQPIPVGLTPFLFGYRGRGYRRSGNLQDSAEDFGPEDYERLLQLDDTIHKKKLTPEQISTIPKEPFRRKPNNTDEENKCGVCLELFEENQSLRRFPCRHVYHKVCADRWLQESNACPICREPPVNAPSSTHSRHNRTAANTRRPSNPNRNPASRNNNNNNNNQHRRGPAPHRQS